MVRVEAHMMEWNILEKEWITVDHTVLQGKRLLNSWQERRFCVESFMSWKGTASLSGMHTIIHI